MNKSDKLFRLLEDRGLVCQYTNGLEDFLERSKFKVYVGIDPTMNSLHLGNFQAFVVLKWFERFGFEPVIVIGTATALIGDPSGKNKDRVAMSLEDLASNSLKIEKWVRNFFGSSIKILKNADWFNSMGIIEYLRKIGPHFRLGSMLSKEHIKSRVSSAEGISYTEFSYQILQSFDFAYLFSNYGVGIQIGGVDQWGNVTSGCEFVKKSLGEGVHALTFPLLVDDKGKKFGKSEQGAIWIDEDKLSVFDFYQKILRIPDACVFDLLKKLTFMPLNEIDELREKLGQGAIRGDFVQRVLASKITEIVHGESGLQKAIKATDFMTKFRLESVKVNEDFPVHKLNVDHVIGRSILDICYAIGAMSSKGEIRRISKNGGLFLNGNKISDVTILVKEEDVSPNGILVINIGKKKTVFVEISL